MDQEKNITGGSQLILLPTNELKEEGLTLTDLFLIFWRRKIFICGLTLLCTLAAVYISLYHLPILYKGVMRLYVSSPLNPMSALAGGIGNSELGGMLSLVTGGLSADKSDFLEQILKSRSLKVKMINHFNLLPRIYWRDWDERTKAWDIRDPDDIPTPNSAAMEGDLDDYYEVIQDKQTGFITVVFWDQDPAFAVNLLNWVSKELERFLNQDFVTDAKLNRVFVEEQYDRVKTEVAHWERTLPDATTPSTEIARELQASVLAYAKVREQLELAKIMEAREIINFKVLDPPQTSGKKDKPKRSVICGLTLIVSGFMALVLALISEFVTRIKGRSAAEKEKPVRPGKEGSTDSPGQETMSVAMACEQKPVVKANSYDDSSPENKSTA